MVTMLLRDQVIYQLDYGMYLVVSVFDYLLDTKVTSHDHLTTVAMLLIGMHTSVIIYS